MLEPQNLAQSVGWLVVGLAGLVFGADFFVRSASGLAKRLGLSALFIGLTIVALGTSLPELAVSVNASIKGTGGLAVGNVLGSNVCNILLILGAMALFRSSHVRSRIIKVEIPQLIVVSLIPILVGLDSKITALEGIIMLVLLGVFLVWAYRSENKEMIEGLFDDTPDEVMPMGKTLILLVLGMALIVAGSQATVDGAVKLAQIMGLSDRIIGFTLVAFGTSVPELVVALVAVYRGEEEMALGNVVGSNIMNILLVLGTSALVRPLLLDQSFFIDAGMGLMAAVVLWPLVRVRRKLARLEGFILLGIYFGYSAWLLLQGTY